MLVDLLLSRNIPFVIYRLPYSREVVAAVQQQGLPQEVEMEELDQLKGFVIAGFDAYKTGKVTLLTPSHLIKTEEQKRHFINELLALPETTSQKEITKSFVVEKAAYLKQVNDLVKRMKAGEVNKVVLSRVISKVLPVEFSHDKFFEQLDNKYPSAFVYLFYLPGKGIWSGASPETLIQKEDHFYETMALAGTQRIEKGGEKVVWQQKEVEEQAFVSEYIVDQLKKLDIHSYHRSSEETVIAGKLAHICTRFQIPDKVLKAKLGKLVKALHPTPAVCGLPREKAWDLIRETERHNRRFYTGFLGPWNLAGQQHLFVNLRCGQFNADTLDLYVGGGLTTQSVAVSEWQETEDKSQTLLSLVENLRNFAP